MRKLATVEKIDKLQPIEGADRIELAMVKGWQVVCRKGQYNEGELVVYMEVDSLVPDDLLKKENLWNEEKNKGMLDGSGGNRVKSRKFRGAFSQGLVVSINVLPTQKGYKEGDDVTETLQILKHDPQAKEEMDSLSSKSNSKVLKYLMKYKAFRTIYLKLNSKQKGKWPTGVISKTDEENVQNMYSIIADNFDKSFYISEKIEGQSGSFYTAYKKVWGFKRKKFGVCSRNLELKTQNNSNYWAVAKKYDIEKKLMKQKDMYSIQGEICSTNVQGNIYKLTGPKMFVFNVIKNGVRVGVDEMVDFCDDNLFDHVPILDYNFIPSEHIESNDKESIVKWFLDYSNGTSVLYKTKREGIVCRLNENPSVSFKVRSPKYLLEHDS